MPAILGTLDFTWTDEAACEAAAQALAGSPARADACVQLQGPLGAGKTTFVRHLLRALGVSGRVRSPTYTVLEPYQVGALEISHFDFYRFSDPREWEDAGFREVFGRPGLKLVEWASRAGELLPPPDLRLTLEPGLQDERQVRAEALSPVGLQLLRALREAARPERQGDKGRDDGPGGGGEHTPQAAPG
jgi:tRNA threonylcarbamoyladenosine biosynthesis protein TsaE